MIRRNMKLAVAALGVTAMVVGASVAQAAVSFDPDGLGGAYSAKNIDNLDWASGGNTFASGGNQAVANYLANQQDQGNRDTTFYTYYQSTLQAGTLNAGTVTTPDSEGYQITVVAKFKEAVTGVLINPAATNIATFSVVSDPINTNYIEIYASNSQTANYAAGTGFNDGVRILKGTVTGGTSSFGVDNTKPIANLAGNVSIDSVVGSGVASLSQLDISVDSYDGNYFKGISSLNLDFGGDLQVPFTTGDASLAFLIGDGLSSAQGLSETLAGAGLGSGDFSALGLGDVNGEFVGSGGPSIQFRTDGHSSLFSTTSAVPEPATAAMGLIALAGLAVASRRRRLA